MSSGMLIDTTKCVGCRSCQVTCKQWNQLPAEHTQLNGDDLGLQNPKTVSASTYTLITYHEVPDASAPGGLKYVFTKRQCMHCNDPACASACPTTAMHKTKEGPVVYDSSKCIGCRYCVLVCPFGVPTADWNTRSPRIHKCDLCYGRLTEPTAPEQNGKALSPEARKDISAANSIPACVKQCPAGALEFRNTRRAAGQSQETYRGPSGFLCRSYLRRARSRRDRRSVSGQCSFQATRFPGCRATKLHHSQRHSASDGFSGSSRCGSAAGRNVRFAQTQRGSCDP